MADGFDIHVDKDRAERIAQAAKSAGTTPEAFVLSLVDRALAPGDDDWAVDMERLAEYDRTGIAYSVDEVFDRMEAKIRAKMAERG